MSRPRAIVAGRVYMVTRRTAQRTFLLRPSPAVNGAVRYCLALAAERTGIQLHVVVVMSNHYHLVLTDPDAKLPKFTEHFNGLLARCLNVHHERSEGFWAAGQQASYVTLEDEQAVLAKCAYALLNPVTAGLVKDFRRWPGELLVHPGEYKARKPGFFFRSEEDGGALPDSTKLRITAPPVGGEAAKRMPLVFDFTKALAKQLVARRTRQGMRFLGASAVRRQAIDDAPTTRASRRGPSPRVATRNKWARVEAFVNDRTFVNAHADCRKLWTEGRRDITWPIGTYRMRTVHNVRCAPACGP